MAKLRKIEITFGKEDRGQVEGIIRKAGIPVQNTGRNSLPTSILRYNGAYFHSIEGARRIVELYSKYARRSA